MRNSGHETGIAPAGNRIDPAGIVVQARHERERFTACLQELLAAGDADLFQRFEIVGHERRADHRQPRDPFARQRLEQLIGIRLQPRQPAEARLKADAPLICSSGPSRAATAREVSNT